MFLRTLFEERAHPSQDTEWYRLLYGLDAPFTTTSGATVTEERAVELTAVWSAITQIAASIASLPLHLYKRLAKGKSKANNHPLYNTMHMKPNPEQTSMIFRECQAGQLLVWGNSYAEIERDGAGQVMALWPLLSKHVEIHRMPEGLIYKYQPPELKPEFLRRDQVLHIVGFSAQGLMGYNPIMKQKEAIGLGMALNEYAGRFFSNGARPSAVLEHPMQLSQEAQDRLRTNWNKIHQGLSRSHRVAILEEGMKLHEFGFSAAEAQSLESRKFTISDIARIWNMPPHMLKDLDRATFSNIAHQGEDFVRYCLNPWLVRTEQCYTTQLLSEKDQKKYFFEHTVEGLLRGTIQDRYSVYATGRQWGILSINDCREKENMNPVDGGDVYMVPLNMIPADQVGQVPEVAPGGAEETSPAAEE